MRCTFAALSVLVAGAYAAYTPTPTVARRDSSPFVSTQNGQFVVNGSNFRFVGTNAYWLPFLPSEDDISAVLANMAASNVTVVRTWGFNDVTEVPTDGSPWLQLLAPNGTTVINNGTDGLQRLDRFVDLAAQNGIHVIFSLTNNWNPVVGDTLNGGQPSRRDEPAPSTTRPRNFLSNDYGGMDAYVRSLGPSKLHSEFYTDTTVRGAFQNYARAVVERFSTNPSVLAWELANDPRCNSSIPTADDCNTNIVTQWHEDMGSFVKTVDPNHLVSSGSSGFQCPTCHKTFTNTPKPAPSATASKKKRTPVLTEAELARRVIGARKRAEAVPADGVKIRGRWVANKNAKRQSSSGSVGSAFDGSTGVDSSDILNAPSIGFGSLQYFPDQNSYSTLGQSSQANSATDGLGQATIGPDQLNYTAILQQGVDFIQMQASLAQAAGKPLALTGFGLVTQENAPFFVPFNSTTPLLNATSTAALTRRQSSNAATLGVTQEQQNTAYDTWLQAGVQAGLGGLVQWQWSAGNLTAANGGLVQANTTNADGTLGQGDSPNDGYGGLGQQTNVQGELGQATLNITST
ncbi:glycoside hydrolase family 5 protein [Peniophora sp. CONT]|nr:glycoside hydrolase family 5 protein [Peniophora sp. CONT]